MWADLLRSLENHGSDEDPITHEGKETTPRRMSYDYHDTDEAGSIPISYYADTKRGWIDGTLGGMMRNRRKRCASLGLSLHHRKGRKS